MTSSMNHWERIRSTIKGEETDRTPISLWRHWPWRLVRYAGNGNMILT